MRLLIVTLMLVIIGLTSCSSDQSNTRLILNKQMEIIIPAEFQYSKKVFNENSMFTNIDHHIDYFLNQDSSKEISFIKLPDTGNDIDFKMIADISMKAMATKIIFKGEKTINDIPMYITEFVGYEEGKEKYMKIIYFLSGENVTMGIFSSSPDKQEAWAKQSSDIIKTLKNK